MKFDKSDIVLFSILGLMILTMFKLAMTPMTPIQERTPSSPSTVDHFFNPAYAEDPRVEAGEYFMQQKQEQYIEEERFRMLQDSNLIYKLMSTTEGRGWAFETYEEYYEYDTDLFNHYFDYLNE